MLFNSLHFLLFFPVVLGVFYIIPRKCKALWLLVCSYYFYMSWNAEYALLILFSTALTYGCSLLISHLNGREGLDEKRRTRLKKLTVFVGVFINLAILFFFKYFNFFTESLEALFGSMGVELTVNRWDVLLPVGISFYTFQAVGYVIDVYRGDVKAEKNFLRYALFVSFFSQLVAGPIERSGNLISQLCEMKRPSWEKFRHGFLTMIWGFFLKMVIADRLAVFVDTVYGDHTVYGGWYIVVATVFFAFQIYCDFAGYSTIACGASRMLGIELMENFNTPYLSVSVKEFWRRWHVSLSSWFKDYLYIPLGGSRRGRGRKYLNLLIVFAVSGLWHGAEWSFVIWGLLNGIYQVAEDLLQTLMTKLKKNTDSVLKLGERILKTVITFILVDISWIFFRANSVGHSFDLVKSIFTENNPWIILDGSLYTCGLSEKEFTFMLLSLAVLFIADLCRYNGIRVGEVIEKQSLWFRWLVYILGILTVIVFGVWGSGYDPAGFIYFQF